jgi:KDO2-lipid IV(A) lauroyltransferase
LNNARTSQLEKLVNITGLSNFQNAHDKGKGVLFVHYHSAATDLFWPCFSLHHHEIGIFIGRATKLPNKYKKDETLRVEGKNDPNLLFKYVKQLKQAQETLKEGGIIHLLPDGLAGTRGTPKILHNRTRNFQPGFVELALQEQVPILPACTFFDLRGKLHVKIFEPFDFGPEAMSDEEKKNMLIDQYVDYLHKCWQEQPWNTPVHLMNRHLDLPLAGGSGSPGI